MNVTFPKLSPVSRKDSVRRLLKDALATGAIACGDSIVEAKLARQIGVGQGLVREVLLELECEGFVERSPFSHTRVATLSDEDARQIFDIRIQLEPLAFALALHGPKDDVASLRELVAQSRKSANSGDGASFFKNHLALFRSFWERSGNKFLYQTLERQVVPLFILYFTRVSFPSEAFKQHAILCANHHEQILEAFLAGEGRSAMQRFVADCLIHMKAWALP